MSTKKQQRTVLDCKDVSRKYGFRKNRFSALSEISFSLNEGQSLAILGASGSGKSTLLHILAGLDKPTTGKTCVAEHNLQNMTEAELDDFRGNKIGFIFQQFFLEEGRSALDNVALPLELKGVPKKDRRRKALQALQYLDLEDVAERKAGALSGGQKQRVAIARAIVNSPLVVFADEPTGNLDSEASKKVMDTLSSLIKKGSSVVLVTHDPTIAKTFKNKLTLQDGKILNTSGKGVSV